MLATYLPNIQGYSAGRVAPGCVPNDTIEPGVLAASGLERVVHVGADAVGPDPDIRIIGGLEHHNRVLPKDLIAVGEAPVRARKYRSYMHASKQQNDAGPR